MSKQQEALKFLDDLDSFADVPPNPAPGTSGEAEALAFLDEMTQKATEPPKPSHPVSRSGTPGLRKSTERVKLGGSGGGSTPSPSASTASLVKQPKPVPDQPASSNSTTAASSPWGWGSVSTVWSTASAAIQQAKTAVDEQVKALPTNEQARKWSEGVIGYAKSAQLDKIGLSS